jgi:hypothetical protein
MIMIMIMIPVMTMMVVAMMMVCTYVYSHLSFNCQAFTMGMFIRSVCSRVCHKVRIARLRYEVYPMSKTKPIGVKGRG